MSALEVQPCGCQADGYCQRHDYTKVCWVNNCDLPFPHLPTGPEHVTSKNGCACYYHNGGDFEVCEEHQKAWDMTTSGEFSGKVTTLRDTLGLPQ